jgi:hypothetical protein
MEAGACLTSCDKNKINIAVQVTQSAISLAITGINIGILAAKKEDVKEHMQKASTALQAVSTSVIANILDFVGLGCPTCNGITESIEKGVEKMKELLLSVEPTWKDDPIFSTTITATTGIINTVKGFCVFIDPPRFSELSTLAELSDAAHSQCTDVQTLAAMKNTIHAAKIGHQSTPAALDRVEKILLALV